MVEGFKEDAEGFALRAEHEMRFIIGGGNPAVGIMFFVEGDERVGGNFDGEDGHHQDAIVYGHVEGFDVFDLEDAEGSEAGFFKEFAQRGLGSGFVFFGAAVDGLPGMLVFTGVGGAVNLEEFARAALVTVDVNGYAFGVSKGYGRLLG